MYGLTLASGDRGRHTPARADLDLTEALAALTLEEKVQLLTGRDFWTTWPIERIGLRRILVSDGPSGVRGEVWDERDPSLNLPSSTALASSWDPAMARRYGAAAAVVDGRLAGAVKAGGASLSWGETCRPQLLSRRIGISKIDLRFMGNSVRI